MLELLSPAGSYEGFIAALAAGADAVYAGGSAYGARAYARNFTDEEFLRAIDVAHLYGKKLYMTVNTLCKQREIPELIGFLKPFYLQGLDGVIVQDIGVIGLIRENFPEMEIHASTQMTITGSAGARYAMDKGAVRIVPARELSLNEIRTIHEETGVEIESFIHGAMCYCYSGQCLMSSFLGGRSGNRGRCAQPCRLPYETCSGGKKISGRDQDYILSMKDLNTLLILPELIESGITSFKIEGRMKKPEYTALVTSIYRKYIDLYLRNGKKGYKVDEKDYNLLANAYVRMRPEEGYYHRHNGKALITLYKPNYETDFSDSLVPELEPIAVEAYASFIEGCESVLTIMLFDISVTVTGDVCQSAMNHPLTREEIQNQLCRSGGTNFKINCSNIYLDGSVFIGKKGLNELRRRAIDALTEALLGRYRRTLNVSLISPSIVKEKQLDNKRSSYTVSVETLGQLSAVLEFSERINRIYIEASLVINYRTEVEELIFSSDVLEKYYISLPYIFRGNTGKKLISALNNIVNSSVSPAGFLVRNYEELKLVRELYPEKTVIADANVYSFNSKACSEQHDSGADVLTVPYELNVHEIRERGYASTSELLIYGFIPMMISAGCPLMTLKGCQKGKFNDVHLKDRKDVDFRVMTDCDFCYNRIMNSVPLWLGGETDIIEKLGMQALRLAFTSETPSECKRIISSVLTGVRNVIKDYTKGHFRKSVE